MKIPVPLKWWRHCLAQEGLDQHGLGPDLYVVKTQPQTLTIFIAIYCWPTISTFWGISLCCCCVSLKKVNNILLVLCWCQWKRAILCCYCLVHIDPYIVEHIAKLLTISFKLCFIFLFPYFVFLFFFIISSSLLKKYGIYC